MPVSSVTEHWIKPDAVTINLNHFGDPDYLQVSVLAGAVVMAFKQDVIAYNAAHNYRTWPLQAANTYLETTSAYNVYARLTRSEVNASALIVYDPILRDIEGRTVSYSEDGTEILGGADPNCFYVFLGQISSSIGSSGQNISREWIVDFRFGNLDTSQYRNEEAGGEWQKMFRLNKVTDMIDVLKTFSSAVFKRLFIGDKEIQDVQRASDETFTPRVDDLTIPTTQFNENRFLSKKKDDRSIGTIASDKGFVVGDFNEGTLGSGASTYMRDGSSYSEVDYLKVRKKATFTNLTIQELKHIGGELILSPAAMTISKVEDIGSGWKCYFEDTDADGRKINQEFEVDDQVMCRTFNLENNRYYWRLVAEVPTDKNYIVIAKEPCDDNSDEPKVGDNIAQLGNKYNTDRQAAIILSAYGANAPSYAQYSGIDSFSLEGNQVTKLSPYGNEITGKVTIEKGSKGWENLEGLNEAFDSLEYGKNNILRNSGFTGDYLTAVLNGSTDLKDTSEMFSPSLKHWDTDKATAQESEISESGKEVFIQSGGSIEQTLYFKMVKDDKYVFSFRGKGGKVTYSVGGRTYMFELTEEWAQYIDKFTATDDGDLFSLEVKGDCVLCELQLERGTVKSAWGISPLDNRSELAKYDSLTYLEKAIKDGSVDFEGGLGLMNLLFMKNLENKVTAGVNGIHNDENSIAYFAGGDMEQAIYTIMTYLDNPNYTPTQDELRQMAKFVVTHGGRAILNDVILRGYIYALGGLFKGAVEIANGKILMNADGSGQLADGNIWWNKYGTIYRKSHDNIRWTSILNEFSESKIIDIKKGTYLDLTEYLSKPLYYLPNSEYDGVTLSLKWHLSSRSNDCAVLSGNFRFLSRTANGYTWTRASELTIDVDNKEYQLVYESSENVWSYYGDGASLDGNRIVLGEIVESATDIQANSVKANSFVSSGKNGLTESFTISTSTNTYTLTFTSGILTGYTSKYTGGGN